MKWRLIQKAELMTNVPGQKQVNTPPHISITITRKINNTGGQETKTRDQ